MRIIMIIFFQLVVAGIDCRVKQWLTHGVLMLTYPVLRKEVMIGGTIFDTNVVVWADDNCWVKGN